MQEAITSVKRNLFVVSNSLSVKAIKVSPLSFYQHLGLSYDSITHLQVATKVTEGYKTSDETLYVYAKK